MYSEVREVHVVFKSHLDIGFTDYAESVINQYIYDFIPKTLDLIDEMRGHHIGFSWTTSSWLIYHYLQNASANRRKRMKKAIANREICWHGLPFTLHSEFTSPELFRAGLAISTELDKEFGIQTIAGKFTDVPGHTKAIIPFLKEAGIEFLHIGINPASKPASIPEIFRWQGSDGSEVLVNYQSGYGKLTICEANGVALWFAHRQDNEQPPDARSLNELYAHIGEIFPDAEIKASNLDAFAAAILPFAGNYPLVTGEIGDTWIHGVGTDPLKVAQYRSLSRSLSTLYSQSLHPAQIKELTKFSRKLLLIPEHTWGMDLKTYLPDFSAYSKNVFTKRRYERKQYKQFEKSWIEQRDYIDQSMACLKDEYLVKQMQKSIDLVTPKWPDEIFPENAVWKSIVFESELQFGDWTLTFDHNTGGLKKLISNKNDYNLCKKNEAIGLYCYEVFSAEDYERFYKSYIKHDINHVDWSVSDFTKPGLENVVDLVHEIFYPENPVGFYKIQNRYVSVKIFSKMPYSAVNMFGAPGDILTCYEFDMDSDQIDISLNWKNKEANRIPEASWMMFNFALEKDTPCYLNKMGEYISPYEVVENGNRALHAVWKDIKCSVYNNSGNPKTMELVLESLEAPLVSIGNPRILEFDQTNPDISEGIYINLHNNLWGTNFPMWYEDDGFFRFKLTFREV